MWQFVNSTEIDLSNLSVTFNLTRTSMLCTIDGFEVKPPMDPTAAPTQFKLQRFFNLTYSPYGEPPTKDSRLKITVEGSYNSAHRVTIIRPLTVPAPDIVSSDGTYMVWLNQSVSGFCNISIPKALLYALPQEWIIIIDTPPPLEYLTEYNVTETETHTFIYFTYHHHPTHIITISGTEVIREFDATVLLPLLLISTPIIALINRTAHRKKGIRAYS